MNTEPNTLNAEARAEYENALILLALSKAVKEDALNEARATLSPGKGQRVHAVVELDGSLDVFEDQADVVIAQKARPWALFAAALEMLNGVSVAALVRRAEEIRDEDPAVKALKARTDEALAEVKGEVRGTRRGQVRAKVAVKVLKVPEAAVAPEPVGTAA